MVIAELKGNSQCENPRNPLECRQDLIVNKKKEGVVNQAYNYNL